MPPTLRLPWLGCLFVASLAVVAPAKGVADDDPGFCSTIQEVLQASRTDFSRWRGKLRGSAPFGFDAERTLPRATDCRIGRESGETRYTCDWEYGEDEEAAARSAADRFLDAILDCLGDKVERVHPYRESQTERRHITLLVIQDDAVYSAELRVSSLLLSRRSTWYVEFSANRRRANR